MCSTSSCVCCLARAICCAFLRASCARSVNLSSMAFYTSVSVITVYVITRCWGLYLTAWCDRSFSTRTRETSCVIHDCEIHVSRFTHQVHVQFSSQLVKFFFHL